jgi:superfamily II DNA/RNA helicase
MEQRDREQVLVKFRNGSNQLLLATDLAARGLDIPDIQFILHYHLPLREKEFTHRNGRTARMNRDGVAYILQWEGEPLPDFIQKLRPEIHTIQSPKKSKSQTANQWKTIHITGGRKDKISKGDVVGFLLKQGQVDKDKIGLIEVKQTYTFVSVDASIVDKLIGKTNNTKLKKKKVRISLV